MKHLYAIGIVLLSGIIALTNANARMKNEGETNEESSNVKPGDPMKAMTGNDLQGVRNEEEAVCEVVPTYYIPKRAAVIILD